MNQHDKEDKLDPQDPERSTIQPPIPTRPPDPLAAGDADKVVGPDHLAGDPNAPPHVNTGLSPGPAIDQVGGAGLGEAPGDDGEEKPATKRDRETRAVDQQDRTGNT